MKAILTLILLLLTGSVNASECAGFTMQFVQVERVADAKIRLQTDDFDKNKDTIHSLIQYKYVSTGRPGEVIEKNTLATWTPSVADIGSVNGAYQPDTVREFFKIPLTEAVIDVTGFEDVADLENCPIPTGLIAEYKFLHSTKQSAKGVLDRFINMMNNNGDAGKLLSGASDMQKDRETLLPILEDIKALIAMTDGSRS